jgi:hypothetical protein
MDLAPVDWRLDRSGLFSLLSLSNLSSPLPPPFPLLASLPPPLTLSASKPSLLRLPQTLFILLHRSPPSSHLQLLSSFPTHTHDSHCAHLPRSHLPQIKESSRDSQIQTRATCRRSDEERISFRPRHPIESLTLTFASTCIALPFIPTLSISLSVAFIARSLVFSGRQLHSLAPVLSPLSSALSCRANRSISLQYR